MCPSSDDLLQLYIKTYDTCASYFPTIVRNWHPVNGQTEEVASARLKHFKQWFGVGKSTVAAVSDIMSIEYASSSGVSSPHDAFNLFGDYSWWVQALFADAPASHFEKVPNSRHVIRNWNFLVDAAKSPIHKKNHVNADLKIWLELSIKCLAQGVDEEYLMLLTYRMETAVYHWEHDYHKKLNGPFGYTEEKFNRWATVSPYENNGADELRQAEEKYGIRSEK